MRERLIIFVKAPRPGLVKTRLGLGPDGQCAAYRQLVELILEEMRGFVGVEVRFAPADAEHEIRIWVRRGWAALPQAEGDLGARMQGAFAQAFAAGGERVVIIGSDCPFMTAADIRAAWETLKGSDLVLGPAEDGGYWLIGLRKNQPELFRDMAWSSPKVFSETMARAKTLGLKTSLLRTLNDVDTQEDWERFISAATQGQIRHPARGGD